MTRSPVTLLAQASFAWQSDYSQFYLIDSDETAFAAPIEITPEMEKQALAATIGGLVVYTSDCLQQHVRIAIYDREPLHAAEEPMTGAAWTRVTAADIVFPSRSFQLSSPTAPTPLPGGPKFFVGAVNMAARVTWKEFDGVRDDSIPVEPDVIQVTLWPVA